MTTTENTAIDGSRARRFSCAGPCLPVGTVIRHTAKTVTILTDPNGPDIPGRVVRRGGYEWHSNGTRPLGLGLLHTEPCSSCMDHPQTSYPDGYQD